MAPGCWSAGNRTCRLTTGNNAESALDPDAPLLISSEEAYVLCGADPADSGVAARAGWNSIDIEGEGPVSMLWCSVTVLADWAED